MEYFFQVWADPTLPPYRDGQSLISVMRCARESMLVVAAAVTLAGGAPPASAVASITCTAHGTDAVSVGWSAVPGATLYDVALGTPGNSIDKAPFASVTATPQQQLAGLELGDLLDGTAYAVKVRAHVGYGGDQMVLGWTNFSAAVACPITSAHPLSPRRLRRASATLATDHFDVAWDPPTGPHGAPGRAVYTVRVRELPRGPWRTVAQNTRRLAALVSDLEPGREYKVEVTALHANGVAKAGDAVRFRTASEDTVWINPHRVSENQLLTVDFLANHNSGTLEGDVGFMTSSGNSSHFFNLFGSPLTSYCVELQKVNLTNTTRTPSNPVSIPPDPQFADYISCNGAHDDPPPGTGWGNYTCICDNKIDRVIAHQSPALIEKLCDSTGTFPGVCTCAVASLDTSARYTGFMATSLPWVQLSHGHGHGFPVPDPPARLTPFGGWYSHPSGSKCPDTTGAVGEGGCTWRRDPRARMVYGTGLFAHGWTLPPPTANVTAQDIIGNVAAADRTFAAIPLKPRCCGC